MTGPPSTALNFRFPQMADSSLNIKVTISFSVRNMLYEVD